MWRLAIAVLTLTTLCFWAVSSLAYEETTLTDGGKIVGVAKFAGTIPEPRKLDVVKDQDYCGKALASDELVISKERLIKGVVVNIEGINKGKKITKGVVILDNNKCYFQPHAQAALAGSEIDVKNSDPKLHNTHAYLGKITVFNLAMPIQGQVIKKKLRPQPGLMTVKCDAHAWMSAVIKTFDHPYFATSDDGGAFTITDVPPGKYKLVAWHEVLGTQTKEITVPAKGEAKVEFTFQK